MQEMNRRIAMLRLLMVEIGDRERQAQQIAEQLRTQLPRIVDFAVRHNTSVSSALSSLADVEVRLREQEEALRHLGMLRERAQSELDALLVTRGVTDAHARLAELEARRATLLKVTTGQAADAATTSPVDAATAGTPLSSDTPDAGASGNVAAIEREIEELRAAIQSASDAAARALTSHAPLHVADTRAEHPRDQDRRSQ